MSELQIYPHGKQTPASFILSCLRAVFKEQVIHGRWLPAEQLRIHIHVKFNIANDIQFSQAALMRVVNKRLPLVSMDPNIFEDTDGIQLRVYRHSFQIKKRSYFFWITRADGVAPPPIIPSQRNAMNWEEDCVLKRLIIGARAHSLTIDMTIEPEAKRPKISEGARIETTISDPSDLSLCGATQATISNSFTSSWWESGDARKLFAPCSSGQYESLECVRAIVMDRIELLESVNRKGKNWKNVVESGTWSTETCPYSESDVLTLRLRSMYLALALRQFVLNMTDDLRTQWTWKRCLLSAIEQMNDIGVEYYSNYRTLARWHRKLAKHRLYFCKTPESKTMIPPFFCDNPDALEAFKRYGVANIQDLRVELMYSYVHQDLIPKLLSKAEHNGLFDDDGDECTSNVVVVGGGASTTTSDINDKEVEISRSITQTPKDFFLETYRLRTLGITTIARWMYAVGFRYKKREKHYFVDGHERPETLAYRPVFTRNT